MNQYQIESRFVAWWKAGADAERSGTVGDWQLELDGRRLVLNPVHQRWYDFDDLHGEWNDTGMVPGEAIFLALEGIVGAKRALTADEVLLPLEERVERISSRVVCLCDGALLGAMDLSQAQALAAEKPEGSVYVWSARDPGWRPLA